MKTRRKIIWMIILVGVMYAASTLINAFFKEHVDKWITIVYHFLEDNWIFKVGLILLCVDFLYSEMKKNMKDRHVSWNKLLLLVVLLFILWKGDTWGWTYASIIGTISFRWFFMGIVVSLLFFKVLKGGWIWKESRKSHEGKTARFTSHIPQERKKNEGWNAYIASLVDKLIAADTSEEAFAVGITGEWGSGKTHFLHKLKSMLNSKPCVVVEFNPWKSSSPQNIIYDYFDALKEALIPHYSALDKPLMRYAKALVELDVDDKVTKYVGWIAKEDQSLQMQQDEIGRCLERIGKPIFVLIDDIDRLDKDELFEVLKLIRNTAQFKNMVYVVTYDKDYIVRMLDKKGVSTPYLYIQKIFPLEVSLPGYEEYLLPQLLYDEINRLDSSELKIAEQLERCIFLTHAGSNRYVITDYLKNFRDVCRFSLAFVMNLDSYRQIESPLHEIYLSDFFWLEVLHYADWNLYLELKNHPEELLNINSFKNSSNAKVWSYDIKKDVSLTREQLKLMKLLFESEDPIKRRIKFIANFSKYFSFRLMQNQIPTASFHQVLKGDEDVIVWMKTHTVKSDGIDYSQSLYFHLDTFNSRFQKLNINIRYVALLFNWLQWGSNTRASDLVARHLIASRFDVSQWGKLGIEVRKWLDVLVDNCQDDDLHYRIAATLSNMYGVMTMKAGEQIYLDKTLLENIEIEDYAEKNMKRFFINYPNTSVTDIILENSSVNKIMTISRVTSEYYEDVDAYFYQSLVINPILEHFETTRNANDYHLILDNFEVVIHDEEWRYADDIVGSRQNDICKLFGTLNNYKEFLERCFVIPDEVMRKHLINIRYSDLSK